MNTFEDDAALDWLSQFLEEPNEDMLIETFSNNPVPVKPGFLGRLLGKKDELVEKEWEGADVLAAAEVVACLLGRPSQSNPDELRTLPRFKIALATVNKAIRAIDQVLEDSNLKLSWEESENYQTWIFSVQDIRNRITQSKTEQFVDDNPS